MYLTEKSKRASYDTSKMVYNDKREMIKFKKKEGKSAKLHHWTLFKWILEVQLSFQVWLDLRADSLMIPHMSNTLDNHRAAEMIRAIWGVAANLFLSSHFSFSKLSGASYPTFIPPESGSHKSIVIWSCLMPQCAVSCNCCAPTLKSDTDISVSVCLLALPEWQQKCPKQV